MNHAEENLNLQNKKGEAISYQVGQFSKLLEDYSLTVKDEGYVADIPDLKYCSAFGETPKESLKELLIAKSAFLKTAKGKSIPQPMYKRVIYQVTS